MKLLIVVTLLAIIFSMGHAMFSMVAGPQDDKRMVNALTIRVALSVALFILLFIGWHFGFLEPHGKG
jgi:uncharacterized BrkB/YihY/UPF0761 family membrane protein